MKLSLFAEISQFDCKALKLASSVKNEQDDGRQEIDKNYLILTSNSSKFGIIIFEWTIIWLSLIVLLQKKRVDCRAPIDVFIEFEFT